MRFLIAGLVVSLLIPAAEAASSKAQCQNRCSTNYQFCMNHAVTKAAKKSCKADRKNCKGQCR
ncbi:MAG TPA: hypothetical protein VK419_03725 [Bryobacteraceae bacterium]|nr:hypothetical protein [Bryobacteraceae bacterium]